jgi:excisionase family DNA binding protein
MAHPLAPKLKAEAANQKQTTAQRNQAKCRAQLQLRSGQRSEMFEQQLGRSVTIDQAAALLHVSRRTIYNRIREGRLRTIRTIGGSQRVLLSSVDENRKPMWPDLKVEPVGVRRDNSQSQK